MKNKYLHKKFISTYNPNNISKKYTILKNEKKIIFKKLSDSISNRNIDNCIKYIIELHCSGFIDNIINKLSVLYFNKINLAEPNGINILYEFLSYYYNKYDCKFKKKNPLILVNDQKIRNFLCFFVTFLNISNQRNILKLQKISLNDFNLNHKKENLISKNLNLIIPFIKKEDPKDIIIPLSEISNYFHNKLIDNRTDKIIYWISWLFEYEKQYHKNNLIVAHREYITDIDKKYKRDFIWILWKIIVYYSNKDNKILINKLLWMYKFNYTRGSKKSKSYLIITAVSLITNPLPKIKYPIPKLKDEQYKLCAFQSLKCNLNYLKLFQDISINL